MSTGINLFFMVHGYNTPLLDYNTITADIENHGTRTPTEMGEKIIKKIQEAFDFA